MRFARILSTDKGVNIVQNIYLTEQPFSNKTTTGCLWNLFFLKFVYNSFLILHEKIQSLKESLVVAMESSSIKLIEAIVRKCPKKVLFKILDELTRK